MKERQCSYSVYVDKKLKLTRRPLWALNRELEEVIPYDSDSVVDVVEISEGKEVNRFENIMVSFMKEAEELMENESCFMGCPTQCSSCVEYGKCFKASIIITLVETLYKENEEEPMEKQYKKQKIEWVREGEPYADVDESGTNFLSESIACYPQCPYCGKSLEFEETLRCPHCKREFYQEDNKGGHNG